MDTQPSISPIFRCTVSRLFNDHLEQWIYCKNFYPHSLIWSSPTLLEYWEIQSSSPLPNLWLTFLCFDSSTTWNCVLFQSSIKTHFIYILTIPFYFNISLKSSKKFRTIVFYCSVSRSEIHFYLTFNRLHVSDGKVFIIALIFIYANVLLLFFPTFFMLL